MKILILALVLISYSIHSQNDVSLEEATLMKACSKHELLSCESLGAYYIKKENWEKSIILGEALCGRDMTLGCTYAGMAWLAKGKGREGNNFLTKACDKFEPFACRSLGRLMKTAGAEDLSHMYFKRACHYGLNEICSDLKKGKIIFTSFALDFLKKIKDDCSDTKLSSCSDRIKNLDSCSPPLTKHDCLLLPGFLSIYFRAKLMQSEAKFSLLSVVAAQKTLKNDPEIKRYSYDLEVVLKGYKPLNNYHYVFGFLKSCAGKVKSMSLELFPESYLNLSKSIATNIRTYYSQGQKSECYDLSGGFGAYAVANLDPLNPSRLDVWKINQDGNLIQVKDGLPIP